jgi:tRNA(Ile)-lysidine synthase
MPSAPPDAAVERFRRDFLGLKGTDSEARIGICVSGGADSLALLLLAKATLPNVEAATVDHGLRPESADEARFVAGICVQMGVVHEILKLPTLGEGNVSDWARTERYGALERWAEDRGIASLLTAHHADDQLETMLMRINRGSGIGGLAGIRATNGRIARPLLGWRKAELEAIVAQCGLSAVADPSNFDPRFDRARFREALAGISWLDPVAASKSAAALADGDGALRWATEVLERERISSLQDEIRLDPTGLPRELVRRLVVTCLLRINPAAGPRGEALDRLIGALEMGGIATLSGVKASGGAIWRFSAAPPRKKSEQN